MERFLKRHEGRIKGNISGFDRILFRGTLRSICYSKGMEIWLSSRGILMKNFAPCAEQLSKQLKEHARTLAEKHGRPLLYLESSKQSKEDCAREIMKEQGVEKGLICILSCVASCRPIHPISPEDSRLLAVLMQGEFLIHGFRNLDLRRRLEPSAERNPIARKKSAARMTRKLRLLRAHALIKKVSGTHYYRLTKIGQLIASTALTFREQDLAVLKAA
jgi:hypothetical protein